MKLRRDDPRARGSEVDLEPVSDRFRLDDAAARHAAAECACLPGCDPAANRPRRLLAGRRLAGLREPRALVRRTVDEEVPRRVAVCPVLVDLDVRLPVGVEADAADRSVPLGPEQDDQQGLATVGLPLRVRGGTGGSAGSGDSRPAASAPWRTASRQRPPERPRAPRPLSAAFAALAFL